MKNVPVRRALWLAAGILLGPAIALAATFNLFSPATGILKGNASTYVTTAATSTDVVATFSGTCNSGTVLKGDGSCAAASSGSVSSVALTMPTGFSVSGSPITTTGTFGVTTALNGPVRGNGSGLITGTTSLTTEVSGVLPVANGGIGVGTLTGLALGNGTSAFTAAASSNVISLWSGTCNSGTFLRGDGSCQSPGGGGTVTSVGMSVPAFLSVSGSPVTGSGTLAVSLSGTALPVANGGTGTTTSTGTGSVVLSASPTLSGTITGGTFSGSGASLTSLDAGNISAGTLAVARGGTGTTTSTGTGSVVLSASPTLTGTVTAATIAATTVTVGGNNVCQSTGTNCPAASGVTAFGSFNGTTCASNAANKNTSCTFNSTGNYTVTFSPAFGTAPVCALSVGSNAGSISNPSGTSSVTVNTYSVTTGSAANSSFAISCVSTS